MPDHQSWSSSDPQPKVSGIGVHPGEWAGAIAGVPLADCIAGYEDEMPPLQDMDRALFGGTPAEVGDAYRTASPITYAKDVVAPSLILAGRNDPRCPIRQVLNYTDELSRNNVPYYFLEYDFGHGPNSTDLVEEIIRAGVTFARTTLGIPHP